MSDVSNFTSLAAALAVSTVAAALKKAEALRARAQECDERANRTSDSWTKQQFHESAEQWRRWLTKLSAKFGRSLPPLAPPSTSCSASSSLSDLTER